MSWRQIHDSVAYSNSLARLSSDAERLYWRMLSQTDPWGRLPGGASKIRALCAPTLGWSDEHIADLLVELEQERITSYSVAGRDYIELRDFDEYQSLATRRRGKSAFPDPTFPLQTPTPHNSGVLPTTPDNVGSALEQSGEVRSTPAKSESESERKAFPKTSSLAPPEGLTAQAFVGFLVDESKRIGVPLTSRAKGQAAKKLADLIAAGATEHALRFGITRMLSRGRPISALDDIVREVAAAIDQDAAEEVDYPILPQAEDWQ